MAAASPPEMNTGGHCYGAQQKIHQLGAIQPYGLNIVIRAENDSTSPDDPESQHSGSSLTIAMVSENIRWYGWDPEELVGEDFATIIKDYETVLKVRQKVLSLEPKSVKFADGSSVFDEPIKPGQESIPSEKPNKIETFEMKMMTGSDEDLDIPDYSELQPYLENRDGAAPLVAGGDAGGAGGEVAMAAALSPANLPGHYLLELEHLPAAWAAQGRAGPAAAVAELAAATQEMETVEEVCEAATRFGQEATGMDRVMVYRFDHEFNGEVIAETRTEGLGSYKGLWFPAHDIPPVARSLYVRNTLRFVADVDAAPVRFHPPYLMAHAAGAAAAAPRPLDLSEARLRALSPCHLEYLRNMGVRATVAASLVLRDRLWGLLLWHQRAAAGAYYPNVALRGQLAALAGLVGARVEALERRAEVRRLAAAQALLGDLGGRLGPRPYLARYAPYLLATLRCESLALVRTAPAARRARRGAREGGGGDPAAAAVEEEEGWGEEEEEGGEEGPGTVVYGRPVAAADLAAVLGTLRAQGRYELMFTDRLGTYVRDRRVLVQRGARGGGGGGGGGGPSPPYVLAGACLLYCHSYDVLLLREERVAQVRWGGRPDREVDPARALHPRRSFETYLRTTRGSSRPWAEADLKLCRALQEQVALASHRAWARRERRAARRARQARAATAQRAAAAAAAPPGGGGPGPRELGAPLAGLRAALGALRAAGLPPEQARALELARACAGGLEEAVADAVARAGRQALVACGLLPEAQPAGAAAKVAVVSGSSEDEAAARQREREQEEEGSGRRGLYDLAAAAGAARDLMAAWAHAGGVAFLPVARGGLLGREGPAAALGDPAPLRQVALALAAAAARLAARGSELTLTVATAADSDGLAGALQESAGPAAAAATGGVEELVAGLVRGGAGDRKGGGPARVGESPYTSHDEGKDGAAPRPLRGEPQAALVALAGRAATTKAEALAAAFRPVARAWAGETLGEEEALGGGGGGGGGEDGPGELELVAAELLGCAGAARVLGARLRVAASADGAFSLAAALPVEVLPAASAAPPVASAAAAAAAEGPAAEASSSSPPAAGEARKDTVLIAEDNAVNRQVLVALVERTCGQAADGGGGGGGVRVLAVSGGAEAAMVAVREHARLALVLMDCQMPGLDGLGAARQLREAERARHWPRAPVAALGRPSRRLLRAHGGDAAAACAAAGMDCVLPKPVPAAGLAALLGRCGLLGGGDKEEGPPPLHQGSPADNLLMMEKKRDHLMMMQQQTTTAGKEKSFQNADDDHPELSMSKKAKKMFPLSSSSSAEAAALLSSLPNVGGAH